ncbi:hypothetical protein PAUR_a1989 [Pseudoalteromonas aurantia 208]|uniref:Uncharacterized protein n=1 Tax=Pseudoalteromonas aurantia 208 TaxID=1314867 RepID=A0ABR9EBN5_9GAMM|nr:hypothetical protein [Pseudoalteromonas aurantia 208]
MQLTLLIVANKYTTYYLGIEAVEFIFGPFTTYSMVYVHFYRF